MDYDVIVIGAGIHGLSAAMHLALQGKKTALLEQFPVPHNRGSSSGQTRIIRLAHVGPSSLTDITLESYKQWNNLQERNKITLIRQSPLLVVGNEPSNKLVNLMVKSVRDSGSTPRWTTAVEVNSTYGTTFPPDCLMFLDENAGVLMAEKCLGTLRKEFIAAGGHLLDGCPVTSVNVLSDSLVRVSGPRGQLSSVALVICAGAWSKRLLDPLGISLPLRVVKTATFYWKKREHNIPSTSFIDVSHTSNYYGLPSYEYPGLVKVCLHDGIQVDPDSRDAVSSEALRDKVSRYVSTYFPCLVPQPAIEESCMYTKTPDNEMIIDTLPKYNNVAFACGFSGSGFKIAPAVGQILSRLVTNQPPGHDITPFRSSRFKMADSKL